MYGGETIISVLHLYMELEGKDKAKVMDKHWSIRMIRASLC